MTITDIITATDPKQQHRHRRICFSFAAYAKSVIDHLRSIGVPITTGLSDLEFTAIESAHRFQFPPDLKSILCEGVPFGAGFPNWRSSSPQQLSLLLSIPVTGIINEVSKNSNFWPQSFGIRPSTINECISKVKNLMEKAPVLVPIYRNFYIPTSPLLNGNPIFYVRGGFLRIAALDLADFFQRFRPHGKAWTGEEVPTPAWAAKSARGVEVWTELVSDVAGGEIDTWREKGMKELGWRLREGGWREEEVREMLMGGGEMDGGDEGRPFDRMFMKDRDTVMWHVRLLALALLRAGWTTEDVVYCMGSNDEVTWQVDPTVSEISMELGIGI